MENCNPVILTSFTKIYLELTEFQRFSLNLQLSNYLEGEYLLLFDKEGLYFTKNGEKVVLPNSLLNEVNNYIRTLDYTVFPLMIITDPWQLSIIDYVANLLCLDVIEYNRLSMRISPQYEILYVEIYRDKLENIADLYERLRKKGTFALPSLQIADLWDFDILYNKPLIGQMNEKAWECFTHYGYDFLIRIFAGLVVSIKLNYNSVIYKYHISRNLCDMGIKHYFFEANLFVNLVSLNQLKTVHQILQSPLESETISSSNYGNLETYLAATNEKEKIMYRDVTDNQSYVMIF